MGVLDKNFKRTHTKRVLGSLLYSLISLALMGCGQNSVSATLNTKQICDDYHQARYECMIKKGQILQAVIFDSQKIKDSINCESNSAFYTLRAKECYTKAYSNCELFGLESALAACDIAF